MEYDQIDITDMQCWVFRLAQKKWNISSKKCAEIFREYEILQYIEECYDKLHVSSYQAALQDVEDILTGNGLVMENDSSKISDKEKEYCAVSVMRRMAEKYAIKYKMSFDDALLLFADSSAYNALFDYTTDIWKEGPDYLMGLFQEKKVR